MKDKPPKGTGMIGIPYAYAEVTSRGVEHTCPLCGEVCITPISEYDADGEHKDRPDAYQIHFDQKHADNKV